MQLGSTSGDPTMHEMRFQNGGRIIALPNSPLKIRVFRKVKLLIVEEAALVPDAIYNAIRPMLIVSGGQTLLLSSPFGRRGFFFTEWVGEGSPEQPQGGRWKRHRISWRDCPRITPQAIERERNRPGILVDQEYLDAEPGEEFKAEIGAYFNAEAFAELIDGNISTEDNYAFEGAWQ